MKKKILLYGDLLKVFILLPFVLYLYGCEEFDKSSISEKKEKRLIIIAMDFSESTAGKVIRDEQLDFIENIKECFGAGDDVYLYQITNTSFNNPKKVFYQDFPYKGLFETQKGVDKRHQSKYKRKLMNNYKEIRQLSYKGTDISGFLHYISREFSEAKEKKYLLIISDGLENSDAINEDYMMAMGSELLIETLKEDNYISKLSEWNIVRTGLWENIEEKMMKMYDEFWEKYFTESQGSYKRMGFQYLQQENNSCLIFN